MSEVAVTVVVPVYNTLPYLTACLDSLVQQTIGHERLQVVAVDDGSTDGSGEELDRYAQRYPQLIEVVHQENSGGPARPCNVGLARATGRYVFFLGADDHLGEQALERLVCAADRWDSDVVCGRMVGTGGRWVNQRLFQQNAEDVPFPSEVLASAISNTKLFRRSMLVEHGIDYPLDLRIGSDQPFTILAMLHARRISVLADYDYYFAVKREGAENLSYTSTWRVRLDCISEVVDFVAGVLPPGEARDLVLWRHHASELATLLRRDFPELSEPAQQELLAGVTALTDRYLTAAMEPRLRALARLRFHLAAEGRLDELRALAGAEDAPPPLLIEGGRVLLAAPGFRAGRPDSLYEMNVEPLHRYFANAVGPATLAWDGARLELRAPTTLLPGSAPHVRLVLGAASQGNSLGPRRKAEPSQARWRSESVTIGADGVLTGVLDLTEALRTRKTQWALRLQLDVGETTYTVPVTAPDIAAARVGVDSRDLEVAARPDPKGRALVEVTRAPSAAASSSAVDQRG